MTGTSTEELRALAMRLSPHRAQRFPGWAKIVVGALPETFAALRAGRTSEWRAVLVARETAVLTREDRARVDRDLAPHLEGWADKRVADEARRAAGTATSRGDARGQGQVMADVLVERITGQAGATAVPVELELVLSPDS